MATQQRLTKRQLKEDRFVTSLLRAQEYFTGHTGRFIAGVAAVALAAAIVFFLISGSQAREREANELLGRASVEFRASSFQLAAVDFQSILDNYGGTNAAAFASFYIANAYFELKNYDQAGEYFKLYLDKYRIDEMLTSSAMAGLAHCYRGKGEMQAAGDAFYGAYKKFPDSYVAADCLFYGAESYAAVGDSVNAQALWNILSKIPGQSQRAMQLRQLLVEKGILDPTVGAYD
jgi:tetratricopeptide (TPR) repeat protein